MNESSYKKFKIWSDGILYIILSLFILLYFLGSLFSRFDFDEFEAIHTAWKIQQGGIIYHDFFQHHHPFFYYILSWLLPVFGESIRTVIFFRLLVFCMYLGIIAVSYRIALLLTNCKRSALVSIILLCTLTMFFKKILEIRPDIPQVLCGLLAIYSLMRFFMHGKYIHLLLSALFLCASFLFLQKVVFLVAGIFLLQLYRLIKGKISFRMVALYWLVFCLPLAVYVFYMLMRGTLGEYVFWNWTINMHFNDHFNTFCNLRDIYLDNDLACIFYFIGLTICRDLLKKEIFFLSVLMLVSVFFVRAPYQQYYLMFFPLMAVFAGASIVNSLVSEKAVIFLVVILSFISFYWHGNEILKDNNRLQLKKVEYVLANTTSADYVYDGKTVFNLFRKDIDYFWFSNHPSIGGLATYQKLRPYDYDIYGLIAKYRPKVISVYYINNLKHEIISSNYHPSEEFDDLLIRNN
jgi:hypothetical protein